MHRFPKLFGSALVVAFVLLAWAAPALAQELGPEGTHPIALLLAESSGYSLEEINALSASGASYGNIARALAYAEATGVSPVEALLLADGVGWGQLFKEAELSPGGNGLGALVSAARRNEHANKDASCEGDVEAADNEEAADSDADFDQACADDDTDDAEKGNNGQGHGNAGGEGNGEDGNGNAFGHDKDNPNGNGQGHGNAGGEGNGDNGNGNAFGHGKGKGDDGDE